MQSGSDAGQTLSLEWTSSAVDSMLDPDNREANNMYKQGGHQMKSRFPVVSYFSVALICLFSGQVFSQASQVLQVEGLDQPVEILKDKWGISHIYAETEHDLFFAQGYNAARDRLFQFEIWRAQATGTTAEILGHRAIDRDHGTRLFKFRGNMGQELSHYHPRGVDIVAAFVHGVNAYID